MPTLIVVLSATGAQGKSVVEALLATKNPNYKIRATTRDPSSEKGKALAAKGVEVVKASFNDKASLLAAFKGAQVVFANTNFWDPEILKGDHALEEKQGKTIVDAAVESKVQTFIYSSLPNANAISKGKYSKVVHFDGKSRVKEYASSKKTMASTFVQAGFYYSNFAAFFPPQKQDDGSFVISYPTKPDVPVIMTDIEMDYGKAVAKVIADPTKYAGQTLTADSQYVTFKQAAEILSKTSGKKVVYKQAPRDQFLKGLTGMLGPVVAEETTQMFELFGEFGYDGGEKSTKLKDLGIQGTTLEQFATRAKLLK